MKLLQSKGSDKTRKNKRLNHFLYSDITPQPIQRAECSSQAWALRQGRRSIMLGSLNTKWAEFTQITMIRNLFTHPIGKTLVFCIVQSFMRVEKQSGNLGKNDVGELTTTQKFVENRLLVVYISTLPCLFAH